MVQQLNLKINIVGCPIVREPDGLAMSSRNMLLTAEERERALIISRTLFDSLRFAADNTLDDTKSYVEDKINAVNGFRLEYFSIVNGYTLQPVSNWDDADYIVGCIALFCGNIRLIDNIKYKEVE